MSPRWGLGGRHPGLEEGAVLVQCVGQEGGLVPGGLWGWVTFPSGIPR